MQPEMRGGPSIEDVEEDLVSSQELLLVVSLQHSVFDLLLDDVMAETGQVKDLLESSPV